jgi:hypothetical protein
MKILSEIANTLTNATTLTNVTTTVPVSGRDHVVEIECPDHDTVIATEQTVPRWTDGAIAAYECSACACTHLFRWGGLEPVYVADD